MQNVSGGFGGGHGQISHIAPSYAAVLSLAMLGDPQGLELIDREALYVHVVPSLFESANGLHIDGVG